MAERDDLMPAGPPHERYADISETHSAVVFFAGDRAYKLKKPVNLGFLDFSTPEARAAACQREIELNRRFAPDVYLGVAEVRDPGGRVCDHLVAMRRMPARRRLSALVQAREPVSAAVRQVARILAAQHASAPRGPAISEQGSRDALWHRWKDNTGQIRPLLGGVLEESEVDEVQRLAGRFLAGRSNARPVSTSSLKATRSTPSAGSISSRTSVGSTLGSPGVGRPAGYAPPAPRRAAPGRQQVSDETQPRQPGRPRPHRP